MKKTTVYGLPLNPRPLLEQLAGASFCVSYATRRHLGPQLEDAIRLVGSDGILLVDNGAFSAWRAGQDTMTDEYLDGFAQWATDILDRCLQAVVVAPDKIDGNEEQNWELVCQAMSMFDADRIMPVWHLHESLGYLRHLLSSGFTHIAFGSSGDFRDPGTPAWHARIAEAFAAIDAWELEDGGVRPRIHMMRAQKFADRYPFDSSDSTNLARNTSRAARKGSSVAETAARIDAKVQASCDGEDSDAQSLRPLFQHDADAGWHGELLAKYARLDAAQVVMPVQLELFAA
jgi:hypothetical protein